MSALNKSILFGTAMVVASLLPSIGYAQAIVGQTPGTDFLAFEAEDIFELVNANDEEGWAVVGIDDPFVTSSGSSVLAPGVASRDGAVFDFNGGGVNDFVSWRLQFVEPGDYSLYISYTMYDNNGDGGYGNEDSIYVSSEFGEGELIGTPADPRGDRDSQPSFYGNLPTGGEWEGNFSWWNAEADGSDGTTTNAEAIYTPELNTTLDFGIASRERGVAFDKIVFHTNPNLSDDELDALPTFIPGRDGVTSGDFNDDGVVDLGDYLIISENFLRSFSVAESFEKGDETGDGKVDLADFLAVRNIIAEQAAGTASVPEPSGALLVGFAVMAGLTRRKRRR